MKVYSKIDLKDGYHQLCLSEESRKIRTFSTHIGLFRYKRLFFGVNAAAKIFQNTIRQILANIPNAVNVSDDILIFGRDIKEHDKTLTKVLETLEKRNLTINKNKCVIGVDSITYFGYTFTGDALRPDIDKVKTFSELTPPKNIHELRSLLGILNYVGKFIPNLADNIDTLRQLLKKNRKWKWTQEQDEALNNLKKILLNAEKLSFYDIDKTTHVYVDAAPNGNNSLC